jgi:hypothetical protein
VYGCGSPLLPSPRLAPRNVACSLGTLLLALPPQKLALANDPERLPKALAAERQALDILEKLREQVARLTAAMGPLAEYLNSDEDAAAPEALRAQQQQQAWQQQSRQLEGQQQQQEAEGGAAAASASPVPAAEQRAGAPSPPVNGTPTARSPTGHEMPAEVGPAAAASDSQQPGEEELQSGDGSDGESSSGGPALQLYGQPGAELSNGSSSSSSSNGAWPVLRTPTSGPASSQASAPPEAAAAAAAADAAALNGAASQPPEMPTSQLDEQPAPPQAPSGAAPAAASAPPSLPSGLPPRLPSPPRPGQEPPMAPRALSAAPAEPVQLPHGSAGPSHQPPGSMHAPQARSAEHQAAFGMTALAEPEDTASQGGAEPRQGLPGQGLLRSGGAAATLAPPVPVPQLRRVGGLSLRADTGEEGGGGGLPSHEQVLEVAAQLRGMLPQLRQQDRAGASRASFLASSAAAAPGRVLASEPAEAAAAAAVTVGEPAAAPRRRGRPRKAAAQQAAAELQQQQEEAAAAQQAAAAAAAAPSRLSSRLSATTAQLAQLRVAHGPPAGAMPAVTGAANGAVNGAAKALQEQPLLQSQHEHPLQPHSGQQQQPPQQEQQQQQQQQQPAPEAAQPPRKRGRPSKAALAAQQAAAAAAAASVAQQQLAAVEEANAAQQQLGQQQQQAGPGALLALGARGRLMLPDSVNGVRPPTFLSPQQQDSSGMGRGEAALEGAVPQLPPKSVAVNGARRRLPWQK